MKRQDDVTIILDEHDKALITQYEDGDIGIHNVGWAVHMPKEIAQKLALGLMAVVFPGEVKEAAA